MSLRPSRRSLHVVPKVKLGDLCPLPEPAEETTVQRLTSLRLDSASTTRSLSRDASLEDDFVFDSAEDSAQDTESSGFGNSVASFMSWTDDVEVETTTKVQELVDELEQCLYGEQPLDKLRKEAAAECADWTHRFPHYRVRGTGLSTADDVSSCCQDSSDAEEVIASHGSCSRPSTQQDLRQKVKDAVIDQLVAHVWSELLRPSSATKMPPVVRLPQPLSLRASRGYHSAAADHKTLLNRRMGPERFLKPLDEQQTARQVSAPSSPPNWSRHVTLPPIEGLGASSATSAKVKALGSSFEPKIRSTDVSPRSASDKVVSLSPIRIEGTGLSKLELAKKLLETHEDLFLENNGVMSRGRRSSRTCRPVK